MKSSDLFPSKYLRAGDLAGKEKIVTVDRVELSLFENDGRTQQKAVVHFKEAGMKPLVCKFSLICRATGADDTDGWPGKRIAVYPDMVGFKGQVHESVRVRQALAHGDDFNDAVPNL